MTPLTVGMFAMIAAGLGGMFVALRVFSRGTKDGIKRPIATSCVAVLLLGVGTFGPSFMEPYTKMLGVLLGTDGSDKDEPKYSKAFEDIATEKTTGESADVQIAHALSNPVPNMDKLLDAAMKKPTTTEAGRQRLLVAKAALKAKDDEADRLLEEASAPAVTGGGHLPSPASLPRPSISLQAQEPGVRKILEQKVAARPPADVQKLRFDEASRRLLISKPPPTQPPK
jgi:hypothetical protein